MDIGTSLYEGELVVLGPIDHEKDPAVESRWTHDAEYMRMLYAEPARPLSPAQVKKKYENIEKEQEEAKNTFFFTIRTRRAENGGNGETREADRLVGFARLYWIEWTHGNGQVQIGIGDRQDRGKGYGAEALRLLLRFAFAELNLFRLTATIPAYNQAALRLFEEAGFEREVCRREAYYRDGRHWDLFILGLLREHWQQPDEK